MIQPNSSTKVEVANSIHLPKAHPMHCLQIMKIGAYLEPSQCLQRKVGAIMGKREVGFGESGIGFGEMPGHS